MLDHLLKTAQTFENTHGTPPDVIYINPFHYEGLCKQYPELFSPNHYIRLGFRLAIVPGSQLTHPEAALLITPRNFSQVA